MDAFHFRNLEFGSLNFRRLVRVSPFVNAPPHEICRLEPVRCTGMGAKPRAPRLAGFGFVMVPLVCRRRQCSCLAVKMSRAGLDPRRPQNRAHFADADGTEKERRGRGTADTRSLARDVRWPRNDAMSSQQDQLSSALLPGEFSAIHRRNSLARELTFGVDAISSSRNALRRFFHRWNLPLCRRLLRLSTVVCETLSTRAMARMPSPFSAKACTWRSNFLPNALALAPKCSMATAFKNGANSRRGVR
jgi:hypothetical protein